MKKILLLIAIAVILGTAGSALAKYHRHRDYAPENTPSMDRESAFDRGGPRHGFSPGGFPPGSMPCRYAWGKNDRKWRDDRPFKGSERHARHRDDKWADLPDEIRTKMTDLAKLKIDMKDTLSRNPVDRAKATEIHGKMATLRQEIGV